MTGLCCGGGARGSREEVPWSDGDLAEGVPRVVRVLDFAVEVECAEPGTRHWRHPYCYRHNRGELVTRPDFMTSDMPSDIAAFLERAAQLHGESPCMGTRTITRQHQDENSLVWYKSGYRWRMYADVLRQTQDCAKGLLSLDHVVELKREGRCTAAILAETSEDWQLAAQTCWQAGLPVVTVYTSLGHTAMVHALNELEVPVLFTDWVQFTILERYVLCKSPALKHIVLIGECWVPEEVTGWGKRELFPTSRQAAAFQRDCTAMVTTLEGLKELGDIARGDTNPLATRPIEDDHALVVYTAGSTGRAKGVLLTHRNALGLLGGMLAQGVLTPEPHEVYIAYLPLAHILELTFEVGVLAVGGRIGYGSAKTLTASSAFVPREEREQSDLAALRPHLMAAVPAILDTIKRSLLMELQSMRGFKGKVFRASVRRAEGKRCEEHPAAYLLGRAGLSRAVIRKVKAQLGMQNLRIIGCGGAALAASTQQFISRVLAPVAQGLGCTETCGPVTLQEVHHRGHGRPVDRNTGRVGAMLPSVEVKLRSVPSLGYLVTSEPPAGEILLGGPQVTQSGYVNMRDKTNEDIPFHEKGQVRQRWFHTGDIGCMEADGAIRIVDRVKDLIKLSGGEFVALGKVETALRQVPQVAACVVFARPDKDHCVVIVLQPTKGWASVGGRPDEAALRGAIVQSLLVQRLAPFEIPAKVKIDDMKWTPLAGLKTADMRVQRAKLRSHYNGPGGLLDQMDYRFPDV